MATGRAKDACLAELRALLSRKDKTGFEAALPDALLKFPRATLRLLAEVRHEMPELYARMADTMTYLPGKGDIPRGLAALRSKWPSGASLGDRAGHDEYLRTHVLVPGGSPIRARPQTQLQVFTCGSCFAQHLYSGLTARGIRATTLSMSDQNNTTAALRTVLRYLVDGDRTPDVQLVFGDEDATMRDRLRRHVQSATHIVLTVGVAPRVVEEHGVASWRMSTPDDNARYLREAISQARVLNASADICLTLSPVPLASAFSPAGVVHDDVLSKSVLRVALADVLASGPPGVHYWPSFEAVKWLAAHAPWAAFGTDDGISRHPSKWMVDLVLDAYCRRITTAQGA